MESLIENSSGGWSVDTDRRIVFVTSEDSWGFDIRTNVDRIYEGETQELIITVNSLPGNVEECNAPLVPFPQDVLISISGTAVGGKDFILSETETMKVAACGRAALRWSTQLTAEVDAEVDDNETIIVDVVARPDQDYFAAIPWRHRLWPECARH